MLINLSNHPADRWTTQQTDAAIKQYATIEDMPFPNIPPEESSDELEARVNLYFSKIKDKNPTAVHLMGEMTFTYRLVHLLKQAGISCIASTTNRTVEERDGKKIVQFQFVQFRTY